MKTLLALMITIMIMLVSSSEAKEIIVNHEYLTDQEYKIALDMPCDWDGDLASTTIYGYYGDNKDTQNLITPNSVSKFGDNLLLDLAPSISTFNGLALQHIAIDYPETRKRCKTGSGMELITK